MATKARHLKTPIQLWIADNRKRLGLESTELARLAGVTEATARGWESRGRPSEDVIVVLERRFGVAAPRGEQAVGQSDALVAALQAQTAALNALADEIRGEREARVAWEQGFLSALRELATGREQPDDPEPAPLARVGRSR